MLDLRGRFGNVSFAIACGLVVSSMAYGQGKEPISLGYTHQFASDIDNGSEVSVDRWDVSVGIPLVKKDNMFMALSASYSSSLYDFSGGFSPWRRIQQYTLGAPVRLKLNDDWTWTSVLRAGSSRESGGDFGESYTYGLVTSFDYKVSENLVIGPGFSYFSQLEDDDSIFPIISVRWKFADRWMLSTGPSEGANSGANVFVKYDAGEQWDLLAGLFFQNNRFRLSRTSSTAANGVGEDSASALYAVAKYSPSDSVSMSFLAGYSFGKEYNVFNSVGTTVTKQDADGAPFVGFRLNYDF